MGMDKILQIQGTMKKLSISNKVYQSVWERQKHFPWSLDSGCSSYMCSKRNVFLGGKFTKLPFTKDFPK